MSPSTDEADLVGTLNFNDPSASDDHIEARFGILSCKLLIYLSEGTMPLRFQLAQKCLPIGSLDHEFRETTEQIDHEITGALGIGATGLMPRVGTNVSGKQKERRTITGKTHMPRYAIDINICGDANFPAWTIASLSKTTPIVGTIKDATFGKLVDISEQARVFIELNVRPDNLIIDIKGNNGRRNKALKILLLKEVEYLIDTYGSISKQELCLGRSG